MENATAVGRATKVFDVFKNMASDSESIPFVSTCHCLKKLHSFNKGQRDRRLPWFEGNEEVSRPANSKL